MKKRVIISLGILILLIIPLISASFFDNFWGRMTGKATSRETNISITVAGANAAQVTFISPIPNTNPTESSSTSIKFFATLYDADGVSDLNDTSVNASFTRSGETTRSNSTCVLIGDLDANSANYSCTITMWYFDGNGAWNINVSGTDLGNQTRVFNTTEEFTYNELKAMVVSPKSLTWPGVSIGATNQTSDNDPTTVNNTGNFDGTIDVTGINLLGETTASEFIPVANFSIGILDGSECDDTTLVNGSATEITNSDSGPGNISAGGGAGQEQLYYCITEVPGDISSQIYSTSGGGSWTIAY